MKNNGFIKISRNFINDPIYTNGCAFSLKEVLLDLTLRAFYEDTTKNYRNKMRSYQIGQVEGSMRQFAEWWNMSKDTVERRLKVLQEFGYIYVETLQDQTVITLVKYRAEQAFLGLGCDTNKDTNKDTDKDADKDTNKDTNKDNFKKNKKVIKKSSRNQKEKRPAAHLDFLEE
jgi:DNA-binding transcriptional MocR family regulator